MPEPLTQHTGIAAPLMIDNIDTDQIIPSREMKAVSRTGLGDGLFAGWRYTREDSREPQAGFVLNEPKYAGASILVAGENFGCGSSREHAVWALSEFGICAIVAKSFGDIFYNNCTRNGVLPIRLEASDVDQLGRELAASTDPRIDVDLPAQTVMSARLTATFEIGNYAKRLLVEGLDPIGLTLTQIDEVDAFQASDEQVRPWIYSEHYSAG